MQVIFPAAGNKFRGGRGELTTDHPSSSYGIPVVLIDGVPHGPGDLAGRSFTPMPRLKDGAPSLLGMGREEAISWVEETDLSLIRRAQDAGFALSL